MPTYEIPGELSLCRGDVGLYFAVSVYSVVEEEIVVRSGLQDSNS